MSVRRVGLALLLSSPLAFALACGDDGETKIIYLAPEGGGGPVDDAGVACEPVAVPQSKFSAVPLERKACTDAQIVDLLNACAAPQSDKENCAKTKQELGACATCMLGLQSDADMHPLYQYDDNILAIPSIGACMFAASKNDEERACAIAFGQMETCRYAACVTPCLGTTEENLAECRVAAVSTSCTAGLDALQTETCGKHFQDDTYGFCTSGKTPSGQDISDQDYFLAVSVIFCGGGAPPTDAGADAGADADADAGDP